MDFDSSKTVVMSLNYFYYAFRVLLLSLIIFNFNSCKKDEPKRFLEVNPQQVDVDYTTGTVTFIITSNTDWNISSDSQWCTISKTSGTKNDSLKVNYGENPTGVDRTALISVKASSLEKTITINQKKRPVIVSTLTGRISVDPDYVNGDLATATYRKVMGLTFDGTNNIFLIEYDYCAIRKVSVQGQVSTVAGYLKGYVDGPGSSARFWYPEGIIADALGNVYVADTYNCVVRKVTQDGQVSTFAGTTRGFLDGSSAVAKFDYIKGVAMDNSGNLYISDPGNNRIRKINSSGEVSTVSTGSDLAGSAGIALDANGNIYVADNYGHRILKVSAAGVVSVLAGNGSPGSTDGLNAQFNKPSNLAVDSSGNIYVVDAGNSLIRKISPAGEVTTVAGTVYGFADGPASGAKFGDLHGIAIDKQGNLYVGDLNNQGFSGIRKITLP